MSYVRWSSKVKSEYGENEKSVWYVFWYWAEGLDDEYREDQYLAMYLSKPAQKGSKLYPIANYEDVLEMYKTDNWHDLGYHHIPELPQKEVLREAVGAWIADMHHQYLSKNDKIFEKIS